MVRKSLVFKMFPVTVEIYHFPRLNQIHTNSNSHEVTLCIELYLVLQLFTGTGRRTPKWEGRSLWNVDTIIEACHSNSAAYAYCIWKCAVGFSKPFIIQNSTAMYSTALVNIPSLLPPRIPSIPCLSTHLVLMFTLNNLLFRMKKSGFFHDFFIAFHYWKMFCFL